MNPKDFYFDLQIEDSAMTDRILPREFFYDYDSLLARARSQLPEKIFEVPRFRIPDVVSFIEGNRTFVQNFKEIAQTLNRDPQHLLKFLLRELATAGNIEGSRAIFQGRFPSYKIQEKLKRYVDEYVICPECKKPDTRIIRERRTTFLKCDACGARHTLRPL